MKRNVVPAVLKSGAFPISAEALVALLSKSSTFERCLPRSWIVHSIAFHGSPGRENSKCVVRRSVLGLTREVHIVFCNEISQKGFTEIWDEGRGRRWRRVRNVQADGASSFIVDEIHAPLHLQKWLASWSAWQYAILEQECALFMRLQMRPQRVLLSGAHGFIGSHLKPFLEMAGCTVISLSRKAGQSNSVFWEPDRGKLQVADFEGFDAIVHLAGENIATSRWTKKKKKRLFSSRVRDTWLLAHALSRVKHPPRVVVVSSAAGYYGNRGDEVLTETSVAGSGFLPELCVGWERASDAIEQRGVRVVHARFGIVMGQRGGVLRKLLPFFRLGLGSILGKGDQYWSWISIDDAISALLYVLLKEEVKGAVNFVSPVPLRQREWSQIVAKHFHRPLFLSLPCWILRFLFGEMAEATMLASARVMPQVLLHSGYPFRTPELSKALSQT